MIISQNRHKFDFITTKVGAIFSTLGLSQNQWTVITLLPTFAAFYFLTKESFVSAAAFFGVASFMDMVDGDDDNLCQGGGEGKGRYRKRNEWRSSAKDRKAVDIVCWNIARRFGSVVPNVRDYTSSYSIKRYGNPKGARWWR